MANNQQEIKELEARLKNLKSQERKNQNYLIPVSIIMAGLIIAGAIVLSQSTSSSQTASIEAPSIPPTRQAPRLAAGNADAVKPISAEDHIRGNPDAPVKLIEFSDLECPFCKRFHPTMQRVLDEYGDQVAWVYRHFPLDSIHSKARREAAAAELSNELGGNEKFWAYIDRLFELTPSNDGLDLELLPQIAEDIGLAREPFEDLVNENDIRGGKYAAHIEENYQDALASGGTGTPFSVIIGPNGDTFPLTGAQPYSAVKSIIDLALSGS